MKKVKTLIVLFLSFILCGAFFSCKDNSQQIQLPPLISSDFENAFPEVEKNESINSSSESSSTPETPPNSSSTSSSKPESSNKEEIKEDLPVITYSNAEYIRCTGNNVNIRSGAGTSYSILGSAEKGTMYAVIEKKGDWYKTYYRNKVAYINASYTTVVSLEKTQDSEVEDVLTEGYKLIGVPYVYGAVRLHDGSGRLLSGFSAQKFDCSSLVQYVFYHGADTLLNTTTRTQVKQGKYVAKKDLQRGDCIYFTNEDRQYNTGIERVGHVAIYLGNNYILHTASDYARIEQLSAKRWSYYIEARRFA